MRKEPRYLKPSSRYDVPDDITQEVGKLIVRWAYLEYVLQTTIWNLAQVIQPIGRLAVREPRIEDRIRLIKDLAELRGIEVNDTATSAISKQAKSHAQNRDTLAHGTWFYDGESGTWCVTLTRGKWSDSEPHHSSKSVVPEALLVTPQAVRGIIAEIEGLIKLAELLAAQVEQQIAPPPEVPPSQFPRRSSKKGRGPRGQTPQHQPSGA